MGDKGDKKPRARKATAADRAEKDVGTVHGEYCSGGCALVAGAVAKARALPAPHTLRPEGGVAGYRRVAGLLQGRVSALLGSLALKTDTQHALDAFSLERANDGLLRRLEADLAELAGRPPPPEPPPVTVSPLKRAPLRAANVPRPQLAFKDPVDNDPRTPWVPKITTKPNALVPLKIVTELDEDGSPIGYAHPYAAEIEAFSPPAEFLRDEPPTEIVLKDKATTPFSFVDTEAALDGLVAHLKTVREIAVDLEHHSYRTFQGFACLVQLSTEEGGDFVVDALALRRRLHALNGAFTDPEIIKVFHGADSDVLWLQRDFGVYVVGLFDTHRAAIALGLQARSLQFLMLKYCREHVEKQFQLADWRARPLGEDLLDYARSDTHSLLYIWRQMRRQLLDSAEGSPDRLLAVFKESGRVALSTYKKPVFDECEYLDFSIKCRKKFSPRQLSALRLLFKWRDGVAREEDESKGYVLPNHMLLGMATALPKETSGILACCKPTPPLLLQNLNEVRRLIASAREETSDETPEEPEPEDRPSSFSLMTFDRQILTDGLDKLSLIDGFHNFPTTGRVPSKLSSCKSVDASIIKCFIPPFERYKLIKKYNADNPAEPEAPSAPAGAKKHILENETAPEVLDTACTLGGKIPFGESREPPKKKKKVDDGEPEFVHKFKKPFKNNHLKKINNPSTNGQSDKEPPNDADFKSFDYKSFDYNVYNKNPSFKKKKRK